MQVKPNANRDLPIKLANHIQTQLRRLCTKYTRTPTSQNANVSPPYWGYVASGDVTGLHIIVQSLWSGGWWENVVHWLLCLCISKFKWDSSTFCHQYCHKIYFSDLYVTFKLIHLGYFHFGHFTLIFTVGLHVEKWTSSGPGQHVCHLAARSLLIHQRSDCSQNIRDGGY